MRQGDEKQIARARLGSRCVGGRRNAISERRRTHRRSSPVPGPGDSTRSPRFLHELGHSHRERIGQEQDPTRRIDGKPRADGQAAGTGFGDIVAMHHAVAARLVREFDQRSQVALLLVQVVGPKELPVEIIETGKRCARGNDRDPVVLADEDNRSGWR